MRSIRSATFGDKPKFKFMTQYGKTIIFEGVFDASKFTETMAMTTRKIYGKPTE